MAGKENRAFKINIIDVLITLMIVCVLAVGTIMLASAFGVNASADDEGKTIEYVVQFKGIRKEFGDNIIKGDIVVDAQKRHNLGTVIEVREPEVYEQEVYDEETKTMKMATNPDFITLEIKVSAPGYIDEEMYYLAESDKEIGVGTFLYIHTPDFCGSGYISSMIVK